MLLHACGMHDAYMEFLVVSLQLHDVLTDVVISQVGVHAWQHHRLVYISLVPSSMADVMDVLSSLGLFFIASFSILSIRADGAWTWAHTRAAHANSCTGTRAFILEHTSILVLKHTAILVLIDQYAITNVVLKHMAILVL